MSRSKICIVALLGTLGVMPMSAATSAAQDRNDRAQQQEPRMYDSVHRDYHAWNGEEDRRYRGYLSDQHRKYREFSRLNRKKQNEYWQWRHDHDDHR